MLKLEGRHCASRDPRGQPSDLNRDGEVIKESQRSPKREPRIRCKLNWCLAIPRHANSLMLSALFTHTAGDIGGIGAVPEVVPTGRRQRSIEGCQPFIVGLVNPQIWFEVRPRSRSTLLKHWP